MKLHITWSWKERGGGGDVVTIIYDKEVTQDLYVIICIYINVVI